MGGGAGVQKNKEYIEHSWTFLVPDAAELVESHHKKDKEYRLSLKKERE